MASASAEKTPEQERVVTQRRMLLTAVPALGLRPCGQTTSGRRRHQNRWLSLRVEPAGTYYRLMKEFDEAVPGLIVNTELDGSLTNIDRVMENQAELGITQFDALYVRAMKETNLKERIRVLALLHSEEIHFIAEVAAAKRWRHLRQPFRLKAPHSQFGR